MLSAFRDPVRLGKIVSLRNEGYGPRTSSGVAAEPKTQRANRTLRFRLWLPTSPHWPHFVERGEGRGEGGAAMAAASTPSGRGSLDTHLPGMHISSLPGASKIKRLVSKKKLRFTKDGFDLDLSYITPRLIAMGYPSTGAESFYRNPATQVQAFIERYHAGHCKVYNLCIEKSYGAAVLGLPDQAVELTLT